MEINTNVKLHFKLVGNNYKATWTTAEIQRISAEAEKKGGVIVR